MLSDRCWRTHLRQNADVIRALGMTGRLAESVVVRDMSTIFITIRVFADVHANLRCRGQGPALRPAIGGAWCRRLSGGDGAGVRAAS